MFYMISMAVIFLNSGGQNTSDGALYQYIILYIYIYIAVSVVPRRTLEDILARNHDEKPDEGAT